MHRERMAPCRRPGSRSRALGLGLSLSAALPAGAARAAESGVALDVDIGAPSPRDAGASAAPSRDAAVWSGVERPWLYSADPSLPPAGHVLASLGVGYASLDRGAARPFAADVARAGAVFAAGGEVGLVPHVSLLGEGLFAGEGAGAPMRGGGMAGIAFAALGPRAPVDATLSGGYLRELGGSNGAWARVSLATDLGRARLLVSTLGEHVASPGRDGVDVLVTTGASYAIGSMLRLGAEYVVQDLEGAWDPEEADGGIRHFLGPNLSLDLAGRRVHVTMGPAVGLSAGSPRLLGRLAAMYAF